MTGYWRFFRAERPLLAYGLSLTFFSSFGQTFLVSLFVPFFLRDFGLGNAAFGTLYSGATLGSALLLPWVGSLLDRARLTRFTLGVVLLMALSAVLLATAWHLALLCLGLLGIRLAGQGLASHTAGTAMARYFAPGRGKALSISSLGFPLGEAVLPLSVAGLIALVGWRTSWLLVAALAVLVFGPLLLVLLRWAGVETDPRRARPRDAARGEGPARSHFPEGWTRREAIGDPRFWWVVPAALLPPFWATGFFLYQTGVAGIKGWSLTLMASAFVAFAATRVVCSLAVGGAIDRLSARRLIPVTCLPMAGGFALLMLLDAPWVAYGFMGLLGVTMGMSGTVNSALWAELYGTRHLGSIRSMMSALMVVSTAASPVLVGFVLDAGWGLEGLLAGGILSALVAAAMALRVQPGEGSLVAAR